MFNEPTIVGLLGDNVIAVGKYLQKVYSLNVDDGTDIKLLHPIVGGRIIDEASACEMFKAFFNKVCNKNLVRGRKCMVCIPSSLSASELDTYKTVVYSSHVADAVFVPATIASAYHFGHDLTDKTAECVSCTTESDWADVIAIKGLEMLAGGTLGDIKKLDTAINQCAENLEKPEYYTGNRLSIINGAGKLLENETLIKKIVKSN